jgi:hypothetical protein
MVYRWTVSLIGVIIPAIVTRAPQCTLDKSPGNSNASMESGCSKVYDAAHNARQPSTVIASIVVVTIHIPYPPLLTELSPYAPGDPVPDIGKFIPGSPKFREPLRPVYAAGGFMGFALC